MPSATSTDTKKASRESAAGRDLPTGRSSGGLRDDLKRFTRKRIIDAALTSFQETGFKETTVERIVELAGTTAPTFYRHFGGKDELLLPLQEYLAEQVSASLALLTPEDITTPSNLVRWLGDYLRMWNEVHRLCKAFWDATSMEESLERATFEKMLDTAGTIERLCPDASGAELQERKLRMGLVVLMLDRLAYLANVAPDQETANNLLDSFADMMWHSVFGPID